MWDIFAKDVKNTRFVLTVLALLLLGVFGLSVIYLIKYPPKNEISEGLMGLLTTLLGAIIAIVSVAYNSHFKAREEEAASRTEAAGMNKMMITEDPVAWNNKGIALGKRGGLAEAIQSFGVAVVLDPKYLAAWNNKGIALGKMGKYREAIQAFDEAISLDQNFTAASENKDIANEALGSDAKADAAKTKMGTLEFSE